MNARSRIQRFSLVLTTILTIGWATSLPVSQADAASHQARTAREVNAPKPLGTQIDAYLKGLAAKNQLSGAVLVVRKGKVLLAKGYGMAVRESGIPNGPTTKYPLPGISFSLSLAAGLRLEDQGKLKDTDLVCSYLASCPDSWKPMSVGMVLDGTSGLGDAGWGQPGHTTADSLTHCQGEPLAAAGTRPSYQNCAVVVLGTIFQKLTGTSWENFMQQEIFRPAGMKNSGQMTDSVVPPARAQDYSGSTPDSDMVYNDYFQVYGTVRDVYAYDNALFGGKLLSQSSLRRLIAARGTVIAPDAHVTNEQQAANWKVGSFLGHQVILTTGDAKSFTGANLRFPKDGVSVIAISNDDQNDVEDVAGHAAAMVFGKKLAANPTGAGPTPTIVDPSKAVLATISLGQQFGNLIVADGAVWIPYADASMAAVMRIDPATEAVTATIKVGDAPHCECGAGTLATAQDQIWMGEYAAKRLMRIDPATNTITTSIPIGIKPTDLVLAAGSVWAISYDDNSLVRVDPATGKVLATLTDLRSPAQIAATDDAVWVSTYGDSMVHRIDPATNKIVASIHVDNFPESLATDTGALWVSTNRPQNLVRIDTQTNKIVASIPLSGGTDSDMQGPCCRAVAVGEGAVWAVAHHNRSLDRVDPQTNRITATLALPTPTGVGTIDTWDVAVGGGSVWATALQGILYRVDPAAMGPTTPPVSVVDPTQAIRATVNVGRFLAGLATTPGAIWGGNPDVGTVTRIDTGTNSVVATITLSDPKLCGGCGQPVALAAAGDQVWVGDIPTKTLVRIDPATNAVAQSIPIGIGASDLAIAAGSLWAIDEGANQLARVDPVAGKVLAIIKGLPLPAQVAATDDAVWVSTYGDSQVHRIDPATNRITASIHVDGFPESLAVDNATLWVSTNKPQNLVRIDARTNKIVATIRLSSGTDSDMQGPCCRTVAVGEGAVWAIAHNNRSLDRIDPQTNRITATLALPTPSGAEKIDPWDVVLADGSLWVNAGPSILFRIDPKTMGTP